MACDKAQDAQCAAIVVGFVKATVEQADHLAQRRNVVCQMLAEQFQCPSDQGGQGIDVERCGDDQQFGAGQFGQGGVRHPPFLDEADRVDQLAGDAGPFEIGGQCAGQRFRGARAFGSGAADKDGCCARRRLVCRQRVGHAGAGEGLPVELRRRFAIRGGQPSAHGDFYLLLCRHVLRCE